MSSRLFVVPAACLSGHADPGLELEILKKKEGTWHVSPIICILIALATAACGCLGGYTYRKNYVERKIGRTEDMAKRLYDDAVKKAEDYKKEKVARKPSGSSGSAATRSSAASAIWTSGRRPWTSGRIR